MACHALTQRGEWRVELSLWSGRSGLIGEQEVSCGAAGAVDAWTPRSQSGVVEWRHLRHFLTGALRHFPDSG